MSKKYKEEGVVDSQVYGFLTKLLFSTGVSHKSMLASLGGSSENDAQVWSKSEIKQICLRRLKKRTLLHTRNVF